MKVISKREYTDKDGKRKMEVILDDKPKIVYDVIIDKEGKKLQRKSNGYTQSLLIEPSQWFIDNEIKPSQENGNRIRKEEKYNEKVALKMREIAEEALKKDENE